MAGTVATSEAKATRRLLSVWLWATVGLSVATGPAAALERLDPPADPVITTESLKGGQWRTRVQVMWDPVGKRAVRRLYHFWDLLAVSGLDVTWIPANLLLDREGNVSGYGRLVWRKPGSAPYDTTAIIAEFAGEMRDGMAYGRGRLLHRSGAVYDGQWSKGLMDGRGRLHFPDGSQYVGEFVHGRRQGLGVYIDAAGAVYDGRYNDNEADGEGTYYPVNGAAYRARWAKGVEVAGSQRMLIVDRPANSVLRRVQLQEENELRVGVLVDRRSALDARNVLPYASESTPNDLRIFPDDERLMNVWRGKDDIQLTDEESSRSPIVASFLNDDHNRFQPVPRIFDLENSTPQTLGIVGAYLQVSNSEIDAEPAMQIEQASADACSGEASSTGDVCSAPYIYITNFGWADGKQARLTFSFSEPGTEKPSRELTKEIGVIKPASQSSEASVTIDFSDELAGAGVDTKGLAEAPVYCDARDESYCMRQAKATGVFGTLNDVVSLSGLTFTVPARGVLEYEWFDPVKNTDVKKTSRFHVALPIGNLAIMEERGEGGEPEALSRKPYQLSTDRKNYRISLPLVDDLPAGVMARWRLNLAADKTSNHTFRVVLQLAGGREIRSREVQLLYFIPPKPQEVETSDEAN